MAPSLQIFLDWFVPPSLRTNADMLRRARIFVFANLFGPPLGYCLAAYLYVIDPAPGGYFWIIAGSLTAFFAFPFLLRYTGRLALLSYIKIQNLIFVILFGSYEYGGVSSPFLCWLLTVPLVALFYFGPHPRLRAGIFALLAFYLAAFFGIYASGHSFPRHVPLSALADVGILSVFCAIVFVAIISRFYAAEIASTAELRNARARAEREKDHAVAASRAKSAFLANMSHELRTPLNSVLGFAQLLEIGAKDAPRTEQAGYIGQIQAAAAHLLSLINDVLELTRIESGTLRLLIDQVRLRPVLEEVSAALRPAAEAAGVTLAVDRGGGDLAAFADRTRLIQVAMNLGSNAIKYNRMGGSALLRAQPGRPGTVCVAVIDTGPGIPPERQADLFQPFNRLGAENGPVEGTGIGLAIAQRLVRMMNGAITLHSVPGAGSTFVVELPAAPLPPASEGGPEDVATALLPLSSRACTLLYIEDDISNVELMRGVVRLLPSASLLVAIDARSGLHLAGKHRPDIVVLDIDLPDMDGFDVLRALRNDARTADIPVIALTAAAMPSEVERGMAAGFTDYLTKPIGIARFLTEIDTVLRSRA